LPGKPLLDIAGQPMVQRVVEQACASGADRVLVATDDARIVAAVHDPRDRGAAIALMTDPQLPSGTDRVAAVAEALGWDDDVVVVNVQGDEPFMPPALIEQAAGLLFGDESAGIATLATPVRSMDEFRDPNVVKVIAADNGTALYFSRSPIPFVRDGTAGAAGGRHGFAHAMRHIGIYAYRVAALRHVTSLPPSSLEQCEMLEQLRALQHGMRMLVATCRVLPGPGVDTESDLKRAREIARRSGVESSGDTR